MKLLAAIFLSMLATLLASAAEKPIPLVILRFDGPRYKENGMAETIAGALCKDTRFALYERDQLNKVLDEQSLGLSGLVDPKTAASIGRLTGARVLIVGQWTTDAVDRDAIFGKSTFTARIIGAETGRVYLETVSGTAGNRPTLERLAVELAGKIAATVIEHADDLMLGGPARDERIARIVQSATGAKRPVLAIRIEESRSGRRSQLPTTETEIGLILQKAGFTIVDGESAQKPDVEITGDARGESSVNPRGGFYSGRATLELKVRERLTGKILLLDREIGDAVEIGEQTAVNVALESAADASATQLAVLLGK